MMAGGSFLAAIAGYIIISLLEESGEEMGEEFMGDDSDF